MIATDKGNSERQGKETKPSPRHDSLYTRKQSDKFGRRRAGGRASAGVAVSSVSTTEKKEKRKRYNSGEFDPGSG